MTILKSLLRLRSIVYERRKAMQDPLFHLTPDQPLDLDTLFGPASSVGGNTAGSEEMGDEAAPIDSTLPVEQVEEIENIVEENKEELEVEKGTLEERIKKVEEEYNEKLIPIYGSIQKRLVTLAKKLSYIEMNPQAKVIRDLLTRE